jgi:cytochrome P450
MSASSGQCPHDPFREAREKDGVLAARLDGEIIPMILRHEEVKRAAKDWTAFSSDAPFRVPIPAEEAARTVRQLPIETDPPEHTEYRDLVEPTFNRPKDPEFQQRIAALIGSLLDAAARRDAIEIVREFALPLQCLALTHLLNMPETEAEEWISWGIHVFGDRAAGGDESKKGRVLDQYIHRQLDRAAASPGDDFFSDLTKATFRGRSLTRDEMAGFANLTFAGGRDTVIQSIACVIGYLANHPEAIAALRENPKLIPTATEEFFRVATPLTHIGRKCPVGTEVHGVPVTPTGRVSLCWASANRDPAAFDHPDEVRLDRRPNPHIAFGIGTHFCLGAHHARLIVRTLLREIATRLDRIELLFAEEHVENEADFQRVNGYKSLRVQLIAKL